MGYYASLFEGAFYVGSDDSFDYVAVKHGRFAIYAFKTQRSDIAIGHRMKITTDERKWVNLEEVFPPPMHVLPSRALP
jgi:hypothetical protein